MFHTFFPLHHASLLQRVEIINDALPDDGDVRTKHPQNRTSRAEFPLHIGWGNHAQHHAFSSFLLWCTWFALRCSNRNRLDLRSTVFVIQANGNKEHYYCTIDERCTRNNTAHQRRVKQRIDVFSIVIDRTTARIGSMRTELLKLTHFSSQITRAYRDIEGSSKRTKISPFLEVKFAVKRTFWNLGNL